MNNNCDCKVIHAEFKQWHEPVKEKVVPPNSDDKLIIIDWEDKISYV